MKRVWNLRGDGRKGRGVVVAGVALVGLLIAGCGGSSGKDASAFAPSEASATSPTPIESSAAPSPTTEATSTAPIESPSSSPESYEAYHGKYYVKSLAEAKSPELAAKFGIKQVPLTDAEIKILATKTDADNKADEPIENQKSAIIQSHLFEPIVEKYLNVMADNDPTVAHPGGDGIAIQAALTDNLGGLIITGEGDAPTAVTHDQLQANPFLQMLTNDVANRAAAGYYTPVRVCPVFGSDQVMRGNNGYIDDISCNNGGNLYDRTSDPDIITGGDPKYNLGSLRFQLQTIDANDAIYGSGTYDTTLWAVKDVEDGKYYLYFSGGRYIDSNIR